MVLEPKVVNVNDLSVPVVAIIFSAAALAVALLSAALSFRLWQTINAPAQQEAPPQPMTMPVAEDGAGAWHGNITEGYTRGPFAVRRMPTRGAAAWQGDETEWVAYRDGERAFASFDLEDVLRACEIAEDP